MPKNAPTTRATHEEPIPEVATAEFAEALRRGEDVGRIGTLCMVLGPYRNLTTLTASIAFLHPNVQVLNHGAERILPIKEANFFEDYSKEKLENFLRLCLLLSGGGKRGKHGGSVTLSHAFDKEVLSDTYRARYGDSTVKDDIQCFFWKESMRVTNLIHKEGFDLDELFRRDSHIRFILPIRNPVDCAVSNRRVGHVKHFEGLSEDTLEATVDFIVEEAAWFLDQQNRHPDRFFHFFQDDVTRPTFERLAKFLAVEPEERWIADALKCWQLKESYPMEAATKAAYRASVERHMARHPQARAELLAMAK